VDWQIFNKEIGREFETASAISLKLPKEKQEKRKKS